MKRLRVAGGLHTLVDDDVYQWAKMLRWHLINGYVQHQPYEDHGMWTNKAPGKRVLLHRAILGLHDGDKRISDHINHDPLDNRRENLRIVNHAQNSANSSLPINNTSGYKGVIWNGKNWTAQITVSGKSIYLGTFDDKLDAAAAYDIAALKYFGEYAYCNFEIAWDRELALEAGADV